MKIPLFEIPIRAGFPSPAEDMVDKFLDLNELLISHPAATYFVRVSGESMKNAGISSGDLLIVDKALEPKNDSIVIASINGEFTVKRVSKKNNSIFLLAENTSFKPIKIAPDDDFTIWGVVKAVIKVLV